MKTTMYCIKRFLKIGRGTDHALESINTLLCTIFVSLPAYKDVHGYYLHVHVLVDNITKVMCV